MASRIAPLHETPTRRRGPLRAAAPWCALLVVMGIGAASAAQGEDVVDAGERCELTKPVKVSEGPKGKGKKTKLAPGVTIEVVDVTGPWAEVSTETGIGYIKLGALRKHCEVLAPPEPPTEPPPAQPELDETSGAIDAAPQMEELVFGAAAGTAGPEAPEGTHECVYEDLGACIEQCRLGHAGSCYSAGQHSRALLSAPGKDAEDQRRVATYYTRACNRGHAAGCLRLGEMYERGEGVPMDDRLVMQLFEKACNGGAGLACTRVGYLHLAGEGVAVDVAGAVKLYEKGCKLGDEQGCASLGSLHLSGQGVARDSARAAQLFRQACDGDPLLGAQGCANLGYLHETGDGVTTDVEAAAKLYTKACAGRAAYACERLKALGRPVPPPIEDKAAKLAPATGDAPPVAGDGSAAGGSPAPAPAPPPAGKAPSAAAPAAVGSPAAGSSGGAVTR